MESFLSLEISDQKVRYIVVEKRGKGIAFKKTGVSTFRVDTSASGAFASFLKELVASQGLKISRIFLTINRRDTLIHQLSLTKMSKEDLELAVPAEIEKIPAYADNEFEFIYHEYEALHQDKTRVVFAAVSDDFLKYILNEIEASNIPCREIEIAPLNVVGLLVTGEFKDSVQALIVLSDHITRLIVYENQQIKYFYSSHVGQESLTTDAACSSWAEELKRALKAYTLENKQDIISKTWFIWDQEKNPSLLENLRKKNNFDIHHLNVLEQWTGESLNPIYLLASVPAIYTIARIKPQFSLHHFLKGIYFQSQIRQIAAVCLIFVLVAITCFWGVTSQFSQAQKKAKAEIKEIQEQTIELEKQSPDIFKLRNDYAATRDQLLSQATYVKLLNRMSWSEVLSVVASELPEELSLSSFKVSDSGQATFTGEAFRMESVAQMLRKVETSAILRSGKFNYLNQEEIDKKKIFRFGILASIKLGDDS